ncbi:MAG: UvrD-helicase domain-containing protein [Anaerolineae bacterium]
MKHFDVLSKSSDARGIHLLEASAGTGKTFAIEHLVTRLLLETDLLLHQILIVTYTRMAARELKMRIRANLSKTALFLRQGYGGPPYLSAYLDSEEEKRVSRKQAFRKLEDALLCFNEASIFTIHGFCHQMLSAYAFETGLMLNRPDPEEGSQRDVYRRALRDFFRIAVREPCYSPGQVAILLKKYQNDLEALIDALIKGLDRKKKDIKESDLSPLFADFKTILEQVNHGNRLVKELLLQDFEKLAPCYKGIDESSATQMHLLASMLENGEMTAADFDALLQGKIFVLQSLASENLKKRSTPPLDLNYPGFFDALNLSMTPLIVAAKDPGKIFSRILLDFQKMRQELIEKEDLLSFDELLIKMQSALLIPAFKDRLRQNYKAAIIDEFQDTDPIQWDIFRELFLKEKTEAFYLVGDPKQSIYGFRNADVYTYLEAGKEIGPENHSALATNYRSDPSLVLALNTFFLAGQKWLSLPKLGTHLSYVPVKPRPDAQDSTFCDEKGRLHFFLGSWLPRNQLLGKVSTREKRWPPSSLEEHLFFPFVAKEIQELIYTSKIKPSEIAILVKDRYQGRRLHEALQKWGVASSLLKAEKISEKPAFKVLKQLINAIAKQPSLSSLKLILAGPLFGAAAEELRRDFDNPLIEKMQEAFLLLKETLKDRGFGLFWKQLLQIIYDEKTVLQQLLSLKDGLYFDLNELAEIIMQKEAIQGNFYEKLPSFLDELELSSDADDGCVRIRQEEDVKAVTIMTIHASKGLEYEIVFALGLSSRHSFKSQEETSDESDQTGLEEEAEKMRQLYVALTRAKKRVYVPYAALEKEDCIPRDASPIEHFFSHCNRDFKGHLEEVESFLEGLKQKAPISYEIVTMSSKPSHLFPEEEVRLPEPEKPAALSFDRQWLYSFSSLSKNSKEKVCSWTSSYEDKEKMEALLPLGSETGTLLHKLMQRLFALKFYAPLEVKKIEKLIHHEVKNSLLRGWERAIFDIIEKTLRLPLLASSDRANFSLIDLDPAKVQEEMEFLFCQGSTRVKGFIDLVFEKEGKYYFIDWKSNWLGPEPSDYYPAALEKAMQANDYFLQASLYRTALERYVKLFDKRPFDECFGGAIYVFLRGSAILHFIPKSFFFGHPEISSYE